MMNIIYRTSMKVIIIFIILLYFTFLYIDIFNDKLYYLSDNIKFICIILCFFLSLLSRYKPIDLKSIELLNIGLFLTVLSDFFLLVLGNYYEIGVGIFSMVQIIYSIRYNIGKSKITIKYYVCIIAALYLVYVIGNTTMNIPILFPLALFYGICLITNVVLSINLYRKKLYPKINGIMVAVGMFLFLLCDINVALYNILSPNSLLYNISSVSMWLFYLPSQVLLALSGYDFNKRGY